MADWRNWADCPYCKKGPQYFLSVAGVGKKLTVQWNGRV